MLPRCGKDGAGEGRAGEWRKERARVPAGVSITAPRREHGAGSLGRMCGVPSRTWAISSCAAGMMVRGTAAARDGGPQAPAAPPTDPRQPRALDATRIGRGKGRGGGKEARA